MNQAQILEQAEKKMQAARVTVILKEPFYATLMSGIKTKADWTCKTLWIDGRTMGFNPAFIVTLGHDQIVAAYLHELQHCAQGHPWRRDGRDPHVWNISTDKTINTFLRDSGYHLPDGVYYAEGDEIGKSAEWIHSRLIAKQAEEQEQQAAAEEQEQDEEQDDTQDDEDEDGDGQGEDGDESDESEGTDGQPGEDGDSEGDEDGDGQGDESTDGDGDGDEEGEGDGQGDGDGEQEDGSQGQGEGEGGSGGNQSEDEPDPLGEVRDAPTDEDEDGDPPPSEQEWKERVMVARQVATSQGKGSDGLNRMVEDAVRPRLDPRALLMRFFTERAMADYSWKTPNVRYQGLGVYLPSLQDNTLGRIALWVDTSGSMDDVALAFARGIVESVIDECKPASVDIYYADDGVRQYDHFEQGDPLVWRPNGGGGTDFRPTFKAIAEQDEQPVCIVGITDLEGTLPDREPDVPSIFLVTPTRWRTEPLTAPWGETVPLEV